MDVFFHNLSSLVTWSMSLLSIAYTQSCELYKVHKNVNFNISDCFSYETYTRSRPSYHCVEKCGETPGCVGVGCDSMDMTSTCCTFTDRDINIFEGNSTIIHQSEITVCKGSDWIGNFTVNGNAPIHFDFSMSLRFEGFGFNCSHFTGELFHLNSVLCLCDSLAYTSMMCNSG